MRGKYFLHIQKCNDASHIRHCIRTIKDVCLHDDVEDFLSKREVSIDRLVDKLLVNHFATLHHHDPNYPN
jgi:hypothetical protein